MCNMTIGHIAKQVGMSTDTIRLYERYRLIDEPQRMENGYRCYRQEDIQRLTFIKRAKAMGFTLKEVKELLTIQRTSEYTCKDIKIRAASKLARINHKIGELNRLANALATLIERCDEQRTNQPCPILSAFERDEYGGKSA